MPEFNTWFPTSQHGDPSVNVMDFGAYADGIGHSLTSLGFTTLANAQNGVGGNGKAYPSATALTDYVDWCAITAAVKAAFSTGGVRHEGEGFKNRPLRIPTGRYITNKPLDWVGISHGLISGTGAYTQIYNENPTAPNNICIKANGVRYCHIENLLFQATGANSIAFDLNSSSGMTVDGQPVTVMSHGNIWTCCSFTAVGGTGCLMGGGGYMGSEQTFIRCTADNNVYGWLVGNANALSYYFITCLGNLNNSSAIRINTGGGVTCINCAFSMNGEVPSGSGCDIDNHANSPVTLINCRTESRRHVRNPVGFTLFMGCNQSAGSSETVLVETNSGARIITTDCFQSRLEGEGEFTIDNRIGNFAAYWITGISAGTGGRVKITHLDHDMYSVINSGTGLPYAWEHWRDGDEVEMQKVAGTTYPTAPSVNGVWTIQKLNKNNFELVGSTYVADTYVDLTDGAPAGYKGYMRPGPRFHLTTIPYGKPSTTPSKKPGLHRVRDMTVAWMDSGTTYTNLGATGGITFTIPSASAAHYADIRGTNFAFVVVEAYPITIVLQDLGYDPQERFFRAGGWATAGTQVASSGVIGNRIEVQLIDGQGGGNPDELGRQGHRWLITSETGTWTISGTP